MSLDKNKSNDDFEDDYLELLNSVESAETVKHEKSHHETSQRIFEDVSSNDVLISKPKLRREDFEDIYSSADTEKGLDDDIIITRNSSRRGGEFASHIREEQHEFIPRRPSPPPAAKKISVDDEEEISDFEERRVKPRKNKKKKSGFLKPKTVVAVILIAMVLTVGVLLMNVNSMFKSVNTVDKVESIVDVSTLKSDPAVKNVLLIGLDNAKGGTSRSDCMMLISVNEKVGKIVITSILRDVHVDIPEYGESKINAAFSWGGADLLVQTVEKNFAIKVDGYAAVDFKMFAALVNALGGVEVIMSEAETEYMIDRCHYMYPDEPVDFKPNVVMTLNGRQALEFARLRMIDNDFERTGRQRKIIQNIAEKVKDEINPIGVFKLINAGKDAAPYLTTTFTSDELKELFVSVLKCVSAAEFDFNSLIVSQRIPYDGYWWYFDAWDGSAIGIDFESNCELLYDSVFDGKFQDSSQSDE